MKPDKTNIMALNRPDPHLMALFGKAEKISLSIVSMIAVSILAGWRVPAIGSLLPGDWSMMQASTALAVLCLTASLKLYRQERNRILCLASRTCASGAIMLAALALLEHWSGRGSIVGQLWVADSTMPLAHPMSIQSAVCFTLLGVALLIQRARPGWLGQLSDALVTLLVMLILAFIAGHLYSANLLTGQSSTILISTQTLLCVALLALVQVGRRAPFGFFSVLMSSGIGSQIARMALPASVVISYLIIAVGEHLLASETLNLPTAAAVTASGMAAILVTVVILLARRINALEIRLRDISITDELTGVYNRRGFYQLGEHALLEARRSASRSLLLFLDVDGLKQVNDTQGHDVGSQLLLDVATLLRKNFRNSDILGRVGGDEFAVLACSCSEGLPVEKRLDEALDAANSMGNRPYRIGFSFGWVMVEPHGDETFDELMERADAAMYHNKRERRAQRAANVPGGGEVQEYLLANEVFQ